jgi:tetratricopeptide (TPR) repeat protein
LERTAWRSLGNAPAATADSLQVEKISLGTGDTQGIAAALLMEAEDQFKNDDPACVSSFKRAIALEERLGADLTLATAYNNLGLYFAYHDDWIAARNSYRQSVSFASKAKYPLWGVYGHANIGYADAHMDHLDEALVELRQTVLLAQKLHYADGEIPSRSFLAVAEIATGDLADARTQLDQSLTLAKSVGNTPFVANTERFLASLEIASDNLPKAHQLLTDASAMRVLSGPDLSGLQQTTAMLALEEQQPASVTESMGRLATTGKTVIDAEEAWRLVAESWLMRGNLSQARSAINRALELAHRSPDTHEYLIPASITEARIDAAGGDTTKALNELSDLLIRADQINDVPLNLEIRLRQGEIQRLQDRSAGDFSQSNHTLEAVFSDANKRGFKLIARKARAALDQR